MEGPLDPPATGPSWIESLVGKVPRRALARLRSSPLVRAFARRVLLPLLPPTTTIRHGPLAGYRIHREGALLSYLLGTDEPGVQKAMVALVRPGMTAYDLGTNVGFLSMLLARLAGPSGRVYSFEPRPEAARIARANVDLNKLAQVTVVLKAASTTTGKATFHVRAKGTASSLGTSSDPAVEEFQVETVSLDDFVYVQGHPSPDFVKIDVEGAEDAVLGGMPRILAEARPILLIENHGKMSEVASLLARSRYLPHVLGTGGDLPSAFWNSIVIAVPEEERELLDPVREIPEAR